MSKFKRLGIELENTDSSKIKKHCHDQSFLNIYTTYILRDFKPQLSYNLLKVYLTLYNDTTINTNDLKDNPELLAKVLKVYEEPLNRFISHNIVTRVMDILNSRKGPVQLLTLPMHREFKALIKATRDDDINEFAENLRRSIFANTELINYHYCKGNDQIPDVKEQVSIDECEIKIFRNMIINKISLLDTMTNKHISFKYQENLNAFYSMLYIYSLLDKHITYQTLTKVHDLIKYGNTSINHSFIPKPCDHIFGMADMSDLQYIDLTTSLCLCDDRQYNLKIDEDCIKDMKAYNLTRLQLSANPKFEDCYNSIRCEERY